MIGFTVPQKMRKISIEKINLRILVKNQYIRFRNFGCLMSMTKNLLSTDFLLFFFLSVHFDTFKNAQIVFIFKSNQHFFVNFYHRIILELYELLPTI